jgi:hypothetical protein
LILGLVNNVQLIYIYTLYYIYYTYSIIYMKSLDIGVLVEELNALPKHQRQHWMLD